MRKTALVLLTGLLVTLTSSSAQARRQQRVRR